MILRTKKDWKRKGIGTFEAWKEEGRGLFVLFDLYWVNIIVCI
jgi:hypothetical protein